MMITIAVRIMGIKSYATGFMAQDVFFMAQDFPEMLLTLNNRKDYRVRIIFFLWNMLFRFAPVATKK
ncbi:hypothetical protein D3C87_1634910 [compost metagenome]